MIILFALMSYLIGSLSSAIIICKLLNLPDPRTQGSGNPGATNVLRIGGKKAAIATLIGDVVKGFIPVLIAQWFDLSTFGLSLVAFAAFLGHLFPIFFQFKGGKGVATAFGCILALAWPVGIALAVTWLIIAIIFRYSSLAALITAALAPIYTWFFTHQFDYAGAVLIMSIILIYRHRTNIQNLRSGKEKKIGK
jgi:glycerol-3-phosphate acyltransferase PlsY